MGGFKGVVVVVVYLRWLLLLLLLLLFFSCWLRELVLRWDGE